MTPPEPIDLRLETSDLISSIRKVLLAAFPLADESTVVDDLRANNALAISLVAIECGRVVGHIAFSPVSIKPEPPASLVVMALAPLAVAPDAQRRGIGSALVQAGLKACADSGCDGVVVLGDPGYYRRFGFVPAAERGLGCLFDVPSEAFMIWEAASETLPVYEATVHFHTAFDRFLGSGGMAR